MSAYELSALILAAGATGGSLLNSYTIRLHTRRMDRIQGINSFRATGVLVGRKRLKGSAKR